jgi:hypothetical protein
MPNISDPAAESHPEGRSLNWQTHYPRETLNAGKNSRVLWAFHPMGRWLFLSTAGVEVR